MPDRRIARDQDGSGRLRIRLDAETIDQLDSATARLDVTPVEYIRRAVRRELDRERSEP